MSRFATPFSQSLFYFLHERNEITKTIVFPLVFFPPQRNISPQMSQTPPMHTMSDILEGKSSVDDMPRVAVAADAAAAAGMPPSPPSTTAFSDSTTTNTASQQKRPDARKRRGSIAEDPTGVSALPDNAAIDGGFSTTFVRRIRSQSMKQINKQGAAAAAASASGSGATLAATQSDTLTEELLRGIVGTGGAGAGTAPPSVVTSLGDAASATASSKQHHHHQRGQRQGAAESVMPRYVPRTKKLNTHNYSEAELKKMNAFESIDAWEPVTDLYLEHIEEKKSEKRYLAWLIYCMVGLAIGAWAIVIFHSIDQLGDIKMEAVARLLRDRGVGVAFVVHVAWSLVAALASTLICVTTPTAAGGGVPEVMAQLNGIAMPEQVKAMLLIAKSVSVIFSVHSGLPVGAEGPMIQFGSIIGGLVASGRTGVRCVDEWLRPLYRTFQNPKDQRDFITAGAAAGVTSVFSAPIGGFLFVMEELASFMNPKVAWMTFTSCLCCYLCVQVGGTYLSGWEPVELNGTGIEVFNMNPKAVTLFAQNIDPRQYVATTILALLPAVAVGVGLGLWAAGFIHLHLFVVQKWRWVFVNKTTLRKCLEPVTMAVLFACIWFGLSALLPCSRIPAGFTPEQLITGGRMIDAAADSGDHNTSMAGGNSSDAATTTSAAAPLNRAAREADEKGYVTGGFFVSEPQNQHDGAPSSGGSSSSGSVSWTQRVKTYLPRGGKLHPVFGDLFSSRPASSMQQRWRAASAQEAGSNGENTSSSNSAYYGGLRLHTAFCKENVKGRVPTHFSTFASLSMVSAYNTIRLGLSRHTSDLLDNGHLALYWVIYSVGSCCVAGMFIASGIVIPTLVIGALGGRLICAKVLPPWSDPGVMGLFGCAAFFSGLSRLTVSLVVIMVEISDDLSNVAIMMVTVIVAKFTADALSHSLYHEQIQIRGMPFLDFDTQVHNLDRHCVADLMTPDPLSLPIVCPVRLLMKAAKSKYSGFPVVRRGVNSEDEVEVSLDFLRRSEIVTRAEKKAQAEAAATSFSGAGVGGKPAHDPAAKTRADEFTFLGTMSREMCGRLLWHLYVSESTHPKAEPPIPSYYDLLEIDDFYTEQVNEKMGVLSTVDGAKFWLPPETFTFRDRLVDLSPFINGSAFFVSAEMAISRAYNLFRSMSLRHLAVVDNANQLVGIIGRKNLLGHFMNESVKRKEDALWQELGRNN